MFTRCALLLCLLACGSPRTAPAKPPIQQQNAVPAPVVTKPVAVAIVFEGWEMWIGNDQLPDVPEDERYPGVLRPLQDELKRLPLTGFPAGSTAAIVTYTDRAVVRRAMAPIETLSPADFGEQKDYYGTIDHNLVAGVTSGLDELAKVSNAQRVLLVIGDGSDTKGLGARDAFAALRKRAATENVEIVALNYEGPFSLPGPISSLDPNVVNVSTIAGIVDQMDWLFTRLKQPPAAVATGVKPLAVALLVMGAEPWMGNDDSIQPDDPSFYRGAFKPIRAALEKIPTGNFPDGSVALVESYDTGAHVRAPLAPLKNLSAHSIGLQHDYMNRIGTDLVSGLTETFTQLAKVDAKRRVVIVVGDGTDTNMDAAKTQLQELAKRAAEYHIEVHAIIYKSALSSEGSVVTLLDPKAQTVAHADEITDKLVALFASLGKK